MKKFNLTVIACIIALFVLSMITFQPTTIEASSNATPSATPRKRTKPSSINANVKVAKPKVKVGVTAEDDWETPVRSPKQPRTRSKGKGAMATGRRIHKP